MRLVEHDGVEREPAPRPRRRARPEQTTRAVRQMDSLAAIREEDAREQRLELRRSTHERHELREQLPGAVNTMARVERLLAAPESEHETSRGERRLAVLPRAHEHYLVRGPRLVGLHAEPAMQYRTLPVVEREPRIPHELGRLPAERRHDARR